MPPEGVRGDPFPAKSSRSKGLEVAAGSCCKAVPSPTVDMEAGRYRLVVGLSLDSLLFLLEACDRGSCFVGVGGRSPSLLDSPSPIFREGLGPSSPYKLSKLPLRECLVSPLKNTGRGCSVKSVLDRFGVLGSKGVVVEMPNVCRTCLFLCLELPDQGCGNVANVPGGFLQGVSGTAPYALVEVPSSGLWYFFDTKPVDAKAPSNGLALL